MAFLHRTYCVMVILATIILFLTPNAAAQNAMNAASKYLLNALFYIRLLF
ncbi:unnamed protein product [Larinioides sclopetarius]|uniref:Uncharacterized protein n=1 Tax=Larinioides sclopetarius TaxID=280406 RepID=A0AAV2BB36_9ARAC